jgi:hypothetical protein
MQKFLFMGQKNITRPNIHFYSAKNFKLNGFRKEHHIGNASKPNRTTFKDCSSIQSNKSAILFGFYFEINGLNDLPSFKGLGWLSAVAAAAAVANGS